MINCLLIFPMEMLYFLDFPGGTIDKNPPANAEDICSIPGLGRFHVLWSN